MSSIAEILPPWKGAQNHLQTTWVWIEVSCPVEQPLRCDLLKLILSIRGICPLFLDGRIPGTHAHNACIMAYIKGHATFSVANRVKFDLKRRAGDICWSCHPHHCRR